MRGDQWIIAGQHVWDEATEDNQEDVVVNQLVHKSHQRELSARPRVS